MMSYDFVLVTEVDWKDLATALAHVASVSVGEVEVADDDVPGNRLWRVPVSCGYSKAWGDATWSLNITFSSEVPAQLSEPKVAGQLADLLGLPVLYPNGGLRPDAFWLAAPGGRRTRARVGDIDDPCIQGIRLEAVEELLPSVPESVPVMLLTEIISDYVMDKPFTSALHAWHEGWKCIVGERAERVVWGLLNKLTAWESMTMRMDSGWPPDGWYPVGFYRQVLEFRDELAAVSDDPPLEARAAFISALAKIDRKFIENTRLDQGAGLSRLTGISPLELSRREWWWRRIPIRAAWTPDQALPGPDMTRVTLE